jgi:hypothetical protein
MGLYLRELYLLEYILKLAENKKVIRSSQDDRYFLLVHRKVARDCKAIEANNARVMGKILATLCGKTEKSMIGTEYPLDSKILIERTYRNAYYRIHEDVIKYLKGRDIPMVEDGIRSSYTSEFIAQYEKIRKIYDFKHTTDRVTNVLLHSQYLIDLILQKEFLKWAEFDPEWASGMDWSFFINPTFDGILSVVSKYAEARKKGGWLETSSPISLPTFLYNPKTRKSLFVQLLQTVKQATLPSDEVFLKYGKPFMEQFHLKQESCAVGLGTIYTYWKERYDSLKQLNIAKGNGTYWENVFGTIFSWKVFLKYFGEFLTSSYIYKDREIATYDFGYKKSIWYKFMAYMYKNYNKIMIDKFDKFYKDIGKQEPDETA